MSTQTGRKLETSSLAQLRRIVVACDAFEADLLAGRTALIEDHLRAAPEPDRTRLLRELLAVELEHIVRIGKEPSAIEYHTRFPADGSVVTEVIGRPCGNAEGSTKMDPGQRATGDASDFEHQSSRAPDAYRTRAAASRYRVVRAHARGGLGEVFVARDAELNRVVALKELRADCAADLETQVRFLAEAEVTGRLEHPGIVPVYSLGQRSNGRPYYAMRFVRGESLKDAVARFHVETANDPAARILGLQSLLRRFLSVCDAIDYAHSRGILHRDLKPANIMLGAFGETLVVDWGLARPLRRASGADDPVSRCRARVDEEAGEEPILPEAWLDESQTPTQTGQVVGTPAYMSPEQAAGGEIEAASDVYGLGATLYAVLTNCSPFEGDDMPALIERVRRGEFPPPRTANRFVEPALDAICRKAMSLKPNDRYGSARALAEDIERWLADEATTAYREPAARRLARWGRHHRTAVLSASAALFVAVIALAVSTVLLRNANEQIGKRERLARENLRESSRVVSEMLDQIVPKLPDLKGGDTTQHEVLQHALKFYSHFVLQRADEPRARLDVAGAYLRLGDVYRKLGRPQDAEAAYRKSLRFLEALGTAPDPDPASLKRHAAALAALGTLCREQDRSDEAERMLKQAVAIDDQLIRLSPADSEARLGLARRCHRLGMLLQNFKRLSEAQAQYERALALQERFVADAPQESEARHELASTLYEYGYVLDLLGETPRAVSIYERLVDLRTALVKENPAIARYQHQLSNALSYLGALYSRSSRPSDSLVAHRKAVSLLQKLVDEHPEAPDYQQGLAMSLGNLANSLMRADRPDEAEKFHRRILDIFEAIAAKDPGQINNQNAIAMTLMYIGDDLRFQGFEPEAFEHYKLAADRYELIRKRSPDYQLAVKFLVETYRRLVEIDLAHDRIGPAQGDLVRIGQLLPPHELDGTTRALLALTKAQAGDCQSALTQLSTVQPKDEPDAAYTMGVAYAVIASRCPDASAAHATEAVRQLRVAYELDFFRSKTNCAFLTRDSRLDVLRKREDFLALLADIAYPLDPFAR